MLKVPIMNTNIDGLAKKIHRAEIGLLALRVQCLILLTMLVALVVIPFFTLFLDGSHEYINADFFERISGRRLDKVNKLGLCITALSLISLVFGFELAMNIKKKIGILILILAFNVSVLVIFADFFFGPKSWGDIDPRGAYWPLHTKVIWYVGFLAYLVAYIVSTYGLLGLSNSEVKNHYEVFGGKNKALEHFSYILIGRINSYDRRLSPRLVVLLIFSTLLSGWGIYILYTIPLGLMQLMSVSEVRLIVTTRPMIFWGVIVLGSGFKYVLGRVILSAGKALFKRLRLVKPHDSAVNINEKNVLFLRPFYLDSNYNVVSSTNRFQSIIEFKVGPHAIENAIVEQFALFGEVTAIATPDKISAVDGARRIPMSKYSDWKSGVSQLIRTANLIVIYVDETEGVKWELETIVDQDKWLKTIFIFPEKQRQLDWSQSFRDFIDKSLGLNIDKKGETLVVAFISKNNSAYTWSTKKRVRQSYSASLHFAVGMLLRESYQA